MNMCTACWWCTALWSVVNAAPSLQALWVWVAYDLNCVKYLPKLGKQNVHKPVVQQNTTQYSLHNVSRVFEITSFCELIWLIVEWVTRTHTSYYFIVSRITQNNWQNNLIWVLPISHHWLREVYFVLLSLQISQK